MQIVWLNINSINLISWYLSQFLLVSTNPNPYLFFSSFLATTPNHPLNNTLSSFSHRCLYLLQSTSLPLPALEHLATTSPCYKVLRCHLSLLQRTSLPSDLHSTPRHDFDNTQTDLSRPRHHRTRVNTSRSRVNFDPKPSRPDLRPRL